MATIKRPTSKELEKSYNKDLQTKFAKHNIFKSSFEVWLKTRWNNRLDVCLGFNTKQFWIYDNFYDVYIDPPTMVLASLPNWRDNYDLAEEKLYEIVKTDPDWLYERDYWYNAKEYEI